MATITNTTGEGALYNYSDIYGGFDYSKFSLKVLDSVFNTSIAANTNIFTNSVIPLFVPTTLKIYASISASGILSVIRTKNGVSITEQLNNGGALAANSAYAFEIYVDSGESINLQYSVAGTALKIAIYEADRVSG
ncbi:MAG: hypothetical protein QXU98_09490 [Candidatus Parvarchaeota archaeon]